MVENFIDYKLNNMTIDEKIGQLIMIDYRGVKEMDTNFEDILSKYNPGGFVLFRSNVTDFNQTSKFITDIKNISVNPIFIATDQEGGRVQRLGENVGFDEMHPMLDTLTPNEAYKIGHQIGKELHSIGVNMDMAPVLDIFSNPNNQVIGNRSFGNTASKVNSMAFKFADGLKDENVISVGKHFPGHGDTLMDSHIDLPVNNKDLEELKSTSLLPFIEAVKKRMPCLMVAHIAVPKVTNDLIPSSLSPIMIKNGLRKDLGYDGIIMPDSLKMNALCKHFTNPEIYLRCLLAGNDILLMPQDIKEAYSILYQGIDNGVIPIERVDESVKRILNLKFNYGFYKKEFDEYIKNNHNSVKHI
jgi:beta-N-acetylhexosaminidase